MIVFIVSLILCLLIAQAILNIRFTHQWRTSLLNSFRNSNNSHQSSSPYFYLVIPALREQKVITRILSRLCHLSYASHRYEIIVALDEKEKKEVSQQHTIDIVRQFIAERNKQTPKISIAEFSGNKQGRAYQLNSALNFIKGQCLSDAKDEKHVFVGVYDADSFPDTQVLNYISWRLSIMPDVKAFQQSLDYRLNIDQIEQVSFSRLLKANAYYQTAWNGIFEIPRFIQTNKRLSQNKAPTFPPYCMGHGEFVRIDTLIRIGGFSVRGYADGIQLGFGLTNERIAIEPIPFFDNCESPIDLKTLIHQHSLWFAGNLQIFRYVLESPEPTKIKIFHIYNHFLLNFKWLFRPICWIGLITLLSIQIFSRQANILTYITMVMISSAMIGYGITSLWFVKTGNNNNTQNDVPMFFSLWVLMSAGFKSIGAWLGMIRLIMGIITGKLPKFRKVERN